MTSTSAGCETRRGTPSRFYHLPGEHESDTHEDMSARRQTASRHAPRGGDDIVIVADSPQIRRNGQAKMMTSWLLFVVAMWFLLTVAPSADAASAPLDCGSAAAAQSTLTPCLSFARGGGDPSPLCCVPLTAWESAGWGIFL